MSKETKPIKRHPMSPRRKGILTGLALLFILAGLAYLIYWLLWGHFLVKTDDAYVNGNLVDLMPQISGTVIAVYVDDTLPVKQGQRLVKLDDTDTLVALQRARANLAQTVRQVRQYYENARQLQANLDLSQANLLQAKQDFARREGLVSSGAVSSEELSHYRTSVENSQSQYEYALYALSSAKSLVQNSELYQHPQVLQAENNFKKAYLDWVRTIIYSPVAGFIAKRSVQVGQQISPSTPLMSVVPLNQIWVDANYKENQLSRLRVGQSVVLTADANSVTYHGKVIGFTPGTGNAFAILPPQNASGNWIKIVQRLAVRIGLNPDEVRRHPLQIGLSMNVTTHTRGLKGPKLATQTSLQPLYSTWIFNYQLRRANEEIDAILHANAANIKFDFAPSAENSPKRPERRIPLRPLGKSNTQSHHGFMHELQGYEICRKQGEEK
jgi:membrane fusion protein (multidrug efflux system)